MPSVPSDEEFEQWKTYVSELEDRIERLETELNVYRIKERQWLLDWDLATSRALKGAQNGKFFCRRCERWLVRERFRKHYSPESKTGIQTLCRDCGRVADRNYKRKKRAAIKEAKCATSPAVDPKTPAS